MEPRDLVFLFVGLDGFGFSLLFTKEAAGEMDSLVASSIGPEDDDTDDNFIPEEFLTILPGF